MSRKHILFISSWYPNRNNPAHGIFNRHFAEAAAIFNEVSVLHVCSDRIAGLQLETHVEEHITSVIAYYPKVDLTVPFVSSYVKRLRYLKAGNAAFEELLRKNGRPDLIQLNVILPAGLLAIHLAEKYQIPLVINECWTGYAPEDGSYSNPFIKWITRRIASRARMIMPVSEYLKRLLVSHNIQGEYEVVPNVVDTERFMPSGENEPGPSKLLHISALDDRQKNVSGIIKAFARALKKRPGMRLTIVGDGDDRDSLEKLASGLGAGTSVVFKGRIIGRSLVDEINGHHGLLMFSNYETLCLVILEAFACGKPVITSNAGGIGDYMNPDLGIVVEPGDEEALENAILSFDSSRQKYNAANIRDFAVRNYGREKIARMLNSIYERVLTR